jgi:secreted PhoX family phosphatase
MSKDFSTMEDANRSSNPSIHDVSSPARRVLLQGGLGLAASALFAPLAGCAGLQGASPRGTLGFKSVPPSTADRVIVPEGYVATPLAPWGEPVGIAGAPMPAFRFDASNSAADQALQMGMHHDGLQFYPLDSPERGLLVINHEYTDDGLLHPGGLDAWSAEKVAKAQAAHGIAVIEIELRTGPTGGSWQMVRPSRHARRITANTPFAIGGPAAGHVMMKTAADPEGRRVLGTFANCACGKTPWGTYLAGEENFHDYFATADQPTAHERRFGLRKSSWYRWHEFDTRFDTVRHPNEPNRFGWVVEVDPMDPASTPVKRTALGRAVHEGAWVATTRDGRAVVYSGEDAVFEYIYKFVSRDRIQPASEGVSAARANAELLDHGTLYVARFDADGRGAWLPLVHGHGPLTAAGGFADQGEVLIKARQASDALGGTKMDRPEWLTIDQAGGWVFCALTNNSDRGGAGHPGPDAANPRANNTMGQIIRWREEGDFDGTRFEWNHLLLAGDPANARPEAQGNLRGDLFASPDTIALDAQGLLWIGTDVSTSKVGQGEMARLGNNQLLACDLASGEVRRFLTGPVGCELTGAAWSADGRTLFVNVQHPGESPRGRNDPLQPRRYSNWPDFNPIGRPRSSTLAIRRLDEGLIGT